MTEPTVDQQETQEANVTPLRAEQPSSALAIYGGQTEWTPAQRAALVQLGIEDAPEGDLQVFLHYAQRTKLDPFSRQIYMISRWDSRNQRPKWTIQTGIDAFRIIAQRSGEYAGQVGPEWCGPDGEWTDVWLKGTQPPIAARVGVLRKGWSQPLYAVAHWNEYVPTSNGRPTGLWPSKPALMLGKVAEALALRKAFPHDLSGIYTGDEMAASAGDLHGADTADTPMDRLRQQVANKAHQEVDQEHVDALRAQLLLATFDDKPESGLLDVWNQAKDAGLLQAVVPVPVPWQEITAPDGTATPAMLPLGVMVRLAKAAVAEGIDHGETVEGVADAEIVADPTEPAVNLCGAERKRDGARCSWLTGHQGRHGYIDKAEWDELVSTDPEPDAETAKCGEKVDGWPCTLDAGHDGEHQL